MGMPDVIAFCVLSFVAGLGFGLFAPNDKAPDGREY